VFDILHLDGRDLTGVPLEERKAILQAVLASNSVPSIRFSEHLEGNGKDILTQACRMKLEGIICKRRDQPYRPGRGLDWLKVKCSQREEFVIGGYTPPTGARSHFGALLLGYYDDDKKLVYAGRVGTGFNAKTLASLHQKLTEITQEKSPFQNLSGNTGQARGVVWVKPKLVAEIAFSNWTNEGLLRHPSFQGLREDKAAHEVVRDKPLSLKAVKQVLKKRSPRGANNLNSANNRRAITKSNSKSTVARNATAEVAGVHLTHPDKVLYPAEGITKRDLADYYQLVADWMLPHVADRVLALVRCPDGAKKPCFFQKHPGAGASDSLKQVNVAEGGAAAEYNLAIKDLAGLISLVQMGVLEIHVWGSKIKTLEKPDRLIFDLDPDPNLDWAQVVAAAREVRLVLEELGLQSFLKTTGGKGLHLVVPVQARLPWDEAKAFCKDVAEFIVRAAPDRYVATMSKAARKGKIFIDYLRNGRGATSIAAYSTRNRPGATVSVPITWDELSPSLKSDHFTIRNLPERLQKLKKDPWADLPKTKQTITTAMRKRLAALLPR
jgi:bifunctional non-homologous end joining protein LigD